MVSAKSISIGEFKEALGRYPALIKSLTKSPKAGVLTLEELDKFRYEEAPGRLSKKAGGKAMELKDVQKLVDWKLRHGTFRPTLPKLVASNADDLVKTTTSEAFALYVKSPSDINTVIKKLSDPLKGIGPATASLLLAVHDPDHVIFFSDEAYRWLCAEGQKAPIKYTFKEFDELFEKAKTLMSRLKVSALDLEKVAYVVMKEADTPVASKAVKSVKEDKPKSQRTKTTYRKSSGAAESKGHSVKASKGENAEEVDAETSTVKDGKKATKGEKPECEASGSKRMLKEGHEEEKAAAIRRSKRRKV